MTKINLQVSIRQMLFIDVNHFFSYFLNIIKDPILNLGDLYTKPLRMVFASALWAPLIPVIIIICCLAILMYYCMIKFVILRRSSKPKMMGERLCKNMLYFLTLTPILYSCGYLAKWFFLYKYDEAELVSLGFICPILGILLTYSIRKFEFYKHISSKRSTHNFENICKA